MKYAYLFIVFILFMNLIVSCTSLKEEHYKTTGVINLPSPKVSLELSYSNDDLDFLGKIDISQSMVIDRNYNAYTNYPKSEEVIVEKYGALFNGNILIFDKTNNSWGMKEKQTLLSSIIYEAIEQYPDMDYIMFPNLYLNINEDTEKKTLMLRLTGKAVRIKLNG